MQEVHKKNKNIGFIIIGDGKFKPDFSNFDFIYDFEQVYDFKKKSELLKIGDFALMPRWIGLSIVECFMYALPMFTLTKELKNIEHSVEYNYLNHEYNGFIANSKEELIKVLAEIDKTSLRKMGQNAIDYTRENFEKMDSMIDNFVKGIETK